MKNEELVQRSGENDVVKHLVVRSVLFYETDFLFLVCEIDFNLGKAQMTFAINSKVPEENKKIDRFQRSKFL